MIARKEDNITSAIALPTIESRCAEEAIVSQFAGASTAYA
jgi:hypothetical protein